MAEASKRWISADVDDAEAAWVALRSAGLRPSTVRDTRPEVVSYATVTRGAKPTATVPVVLLAAVALAAAIPLTGRSADVAAIPPRPEWLFAFVMPLVAVALLAASTRGARLVLSMVVSCALTHTIALALPPAVEVAVVPHLNFVEDFPSALRGALRVGLSFGGSVGAASSLSVFMYLRVLPGRPAVAVLLSSVVGWALFATWWALGFVPGPWLQSLGTWISSGTSLAIVLSACFPAFARPGK